MGILDHRKTWHFSVKAGNEACLQAFHQAMTSPGFKIMAAKWTVEEHSIQTNRGQKESQPGNIATYQGRGGIVGLMTIFIERARKEEREAIGSQITFTIDSDSPRGSTECSMWLSDWKVDVLGFIAD
ncbi:MAG TPA: hypothetical protein VFV38_14915, partial [Ktedonobacteraceae bacterium]|nr:hypothetical protein [Ktedonobacteraceae bacterium]